MVFIFWLNWDLIENNNSFPLSFHPHPEKKLFLIFQYEKKAGIYYGFHFFLGQNFKQGTHSIIIFLKLEIGWFPVQMVIIKHECCSIWHIATVSEKLYINSIGLKSNQTFQWHLPSPCDIQQPLYLSSSHDCGFALILQWLFLILLHLILKLIKPFSSVKAFEQFHTHNISMY